MGGRVYSTTIRSENASRVYGAVMGTLCSGGFMGDEILPVFRVATDAPATSGESGGARRGSVAPRGTTRAAAQARPIPGRGASRPSPVRLRWDSRRHLRVVRRRTTPRAPSERPDDRSRSSARALLFSAWTRPREQTCRGAGTGSRSHFQRSRSKSSMLCGVRGPECPLITRMSPAMHTASPPRRRASFGESGTRSSMRSHPSMSSASTKVMPPWTAPGGSWHSSYAKLV